MAGVVISEGGSKDWLSVWCEDMSERMLETIAGGRTQAWQATISLSWPT
jgi:hypothetical protein